MSQLYEELEKQARLLSPHEKASLARILIQELESHSNADVETLWIEEAKQRYEAYRKGELNSLEGDEVMSRVRNHLK